MFQKPKKLSLYIICIKTYHNRVLKMYIHFVYSDPRLIKNSVQIYKNLCIDLDKYVYLIALIFLWCSLVVFRNFGYNF